MKHECDVLIIGSGAGGASVASVLAKTGRDIMMIEEGPDAASIPLFATATRTLPQLWRNAGLTMTLGSTPVAYAEGRCVGGGTQINSGIFQRAPDDILDEWAKKYSIADFSAEKLRPYYERAETMAQVAPAPVTLGEDSALLKRAAETQGWRWAMLDQAALGMASAPHASLARAPDAALSTATSVLSEAKNRGLRLVSDCRAERLEIENGRVTQVHARHRGQRIAIRANHIFLCAGAIYSPFLLQKSGLRHPAIGRGMRLHPTLKLLAFFDHTIDAAATRLPCVAVTEFMPQARFGGSVFTPAFFGMALAENWHTRGIHINDAKNAALYYAMVRPEGAGSVHALPWLPDPVVLFHLTAQDRHAIATAAQTLAVGLFAAGASRVYPSLRGHKGWQNAAQAQQLSIKPGEANVMSVHLFSSLRPGENAALCATDSFGNLRGLKNLTVADASQISEAPGVNPQATVMALALRSAEHFVSRA